MDFTAVDSASPGGIKTIPLGEPVIRASRSGIVHRRSWAVLSLPCRAPPMRRVRNRAIVLRHPHARVEVGKMIRGASGQHGGPAGGIQTEEKHAWLALRSHVGSAVEFGQGGHPRQDWHSPRADRHKKRRDADPRVAIEGIELEAPGNQWPERRCGNPPVREQEVAPDLRHDPRAAGQRPGPVIGLAEQGIHLRL